MKEKAELPPSLLEHAPWNSIVNPIWMASSFLIKRNLAKYRFPAKISESESLQLIEIFKESLLKINELDRPLLLRADELSPLDKEFLFEHFLCLQSFQSTLSGQAFLIDNSSCFLGLLNIEDHVQFELIDYKGAWDKAYAHLSVIETSFGSITDYAFSSRFGYLSSNPGYAGTGLIISVYLHLPALIHTKQLQEVLLKQKEEDVFALSLEGKTDEFIGDLLIMRNLYTLGVSEENILHSLNAQTMKLMAAEKAIRIHLQQQNSLETKDQISRAYGLLIHSYQLQTKEALNCLSLIKLGLDLGWIKGISDQKINEIFFSCRRAHLCHLLKEKTLDNQELPRKRAEFLHSQLKEVQLHDF